MTAFLFVALFYLQYLLFPPFFLFSYVCPSKINIKDSSYFSNAFNMKILKYKSMISYQYFESSARALYAKIIQNGQRQPTLLLIAGFTE